MMEKNKLTVGEQIVQFIEYGACIGLGYLIGRWWTFIQLIE